MDDGQRPSAAISSPVLAGARGCCPRCGSRTLFVGWVQFAQRCRVCGLDFAAFNVGDGPAAFLTLILGALVAGMAIAVELIFSPPWWVHVLVWPPITLALIFASLRVTKGMLLALEYLNAAREGRISRRP
jgi:uncharacterized protein (DUF983 family)